MSWDWRRIAFPSPGAEYWPEGRGRINQAGLDFYKRLTEELLEAGIRPFATLFHWDMPLDLYRSHGGFRSREVCDFVADYVEVVVNALGDGIQDWITINEPFEHAAFGHLLGDHAPGRRSIKEFLRVMHHQLLGHGRAMERIRSISPQARAGITLSFTPILPATDSPRDKQAGAGGQSTTESYKPWIHSTKQKYPEDLQKRLGWFWPRIKPGDMQEIAVKTDFVGVNHYSIEYARYRWYVPFLKAWISGARTAESESEKAGKRYTAMGWEVYPPGMTEVLRMIREDYGNPPVYITENGAAFEDTVSNSRVHDSKRVEYLRDYLEVVARARTSGSDLRGYFVWSLLDNFEWATGYSKRFGIVYTDFESQKRIIKDSGHWYSTLIKKLKNGKTINENAR